MDKSYIGLYRMSVGTAPPFSFHAFTSSDIRAMTPRMSCEDWRDSVSANSPIVVKELAKLSPSCTSPSMVHNGRSPLTEVLRACSWVTIASFAACRAISCCRTSSALAKACRASSSAFARASCLACSSFCCCSSFSFNFAFSNDSAETSAVPPLDLSCVSSLSLRFPWQPRSRCYFGQLQSKCSLGKPRSKCFWQRKIVQTMFSG